MNSKKRYQLKLEDVFNEMEIHVNMRITGEWTLDDHREHHISMRRG